MNFFQNMISSIMKRTLRLDSLGLKDFGVLHKDLNKTTESIMSTTGLGGVFCENCDIAERKVNIDESMKRFFGVADWAIDSEEATRLWNETENLLS